MALDGNATGEHCSRLRVKASAVGNPEEACRLLTEMGQLLTKRCASLAASQQGFNCAL